MSFAHAWAILLSMGRSYFRMNQQYVHLVSAICNTKSDLCHHSQSQAITTFSILMFNSPL